MPPLAVFDGEVLAPQPAANKGNIAVVTNHGDFSLTTIPPGSDNLMSVRRVKGTMVRHNIFDTIRGFSFQALRDSTENSSASAKWPTKRRNMTAK